MYQVQCEAQAFLKELERYVGLHTICVRLSSGSVLGQAVRWASHPENVHR